MTASAARTASTLTLVPAPRSTPAPAPAPAGFTPGVRPAQATLPLQWEPPVPAPGTVTALRGRTPLTAVAAPAPSSAVTYDDGLPPDLQAWVGRLAAAVLEVLHGARPAGQLTRWFAPRVHRALADRATRVRPLQQGPPRIAVRSVHVSAREREDAGDMPVVEAAVVVAVGGRCRAVALRLEPHAGRWRVTALEVG